MKAKEFRGILASKKAQWTIPDDIDDQVELDEQKQYYEMGAFDPPAGVLTARYPRMRPAMDEEFVSWAPNTLRRLRPKTKKLPARWDWRDVKNQNWITPIHSQGGCGSCIAFASTAAVESHRGIEQGKPDMSLDLSEASLFFVNNRQCNPSDPRYGWWVPEALDFLVEEGICFEENHRPRPEDVV